MLVQLHSFLPCNKKAQQLINKVLTVKALKLIIITLDTNRKKE